MNKKPIRVYISDTHNNMGDLLTLNILQKLGVSHIRSNRYIADMCAIGSILDQTFLKDKQTFKRSIKTCLQYFSKLFSKNKLVVWGSGFIADEKTMSQKKDNSFTRDLDIRLLRGKLTRSRCEKILMKNLSEVPIGDPGLLASILVEDEATPVYDLGIILHYADSKKDIEHKLKLENKTYIFINITDSVTTVINNMRKCRTILSSAMHGLIVSDSFGIPNKWLNVSKNVFGNGYKFEDYYSIYSCTRPKPLDIRSDVITDETVEIIIKEYCIDFNEVSSIKNTILSTLHTYINNEK